jgi:hypothetical protein
MHCIQIATIFFTWAKRRIPDTSGIGFGTIFNKSSAPWMQSVVSIQIVEVTEAFEAPSLGEYLVRELQRRQNGIGIRVS